MDISYWTNYNPNIDIDHTLKKYYGQYLYKLVLYAPGGRVIDSKLPVVDALIRRREHSKYRFKSSGNWWLYRNNKDIDKADIAFLEVLKSVRQNRALGLKIRVEEPYVQIYADAETKLQDFVEQHCMVFPRNYIIGFAGPENLETERVLDSGAIIRRVDTGYRYKVVIRDGRYSTETKQQILRYITALGPEQAKLSPSAVVNLRSSGNYIWNLYLYVNDPSVTSFIELISPGSVLNIHEMVIVDNK